MHRAQSLRSIFRYSIMRVSGLFVYPVKSLRGFAVKSADVDDLGIVGDRRFMMVDAEGRHLTQRTLPAMARIDALLDGGFLTLRADSAGSVRVPLQAGGSATLRQVSIWRSHGLQAEDAGNEAAEWLSGFLDTPCRLVRIGREFQRVVLMKPKFFPFRLPASDEWIEGRIPTAHVVNFADGYPFMAVSEASLSALNDRLIERGEEPVPMDRFRPSFVIADCAAHAEDTWPMIRVGEIVMRSAGPCSRCIVTTTDQRTGERAPEPLRTLASYRRDASDSTDVNFGQNFIHETKRGTLRVGDAVTLAQPE